LEKYPRATPKHAKLHFHDLRRTANQAFYQAGLGEEEREIMLGHSDGEGKTTNRGYLNDPEIMLPPIQKKLDDFFYRNKSQEQREFDEKHPPVPRAECLVELKKGLLEIMEAGGLRWNGTSWEREEPSP
jgi:hypothetical protein